MNQLIERDRGFSVEYIFDPMGTVELIYQGFDFPMGMENLVRYMPPQDGYRPEKHSAQQNGERFFFVIGMAIKKARLVI